MSATKRPGVATHYVRYLGGNLLVMLASFVSFPLMARLLDNHEFGVLGYYETWLLVAVGVLKLGTQHAILRFYPHGGDEHALARFGTNHLLVPLLLSLLLWLACLATMLAIDANHPLPERGVVFVVMMTIPVAIWCSFSEWVLLTLERSDLVVRLRVLWRWGEVAAVLLVVGLVDRSAHGAFLARLAASLAAGAWLWAWARRHVRFRLSMLDRGSVFAGFAFGLPMMVNEMINLLFAFADRVLLKHILGNFTAVGVYTIGYGLAVALSNVLHQALYQAFTPAAVRIYEGEGPAAIVALKREVLGVMIYPIGLATAWLLTAGSDLMITLAGEAKAASAPVFVVSCLAMAWFPLFDIGGYGLLLQKRSRRYLLVTGSAGLLNVLLNVALIPSMGVMGAVTATAISYVYLTIVHVYACPAELRALPPPAVFARVGVATIVATAAGMVAGALAPDVRIARLVLVVAVAGIAYAVVALTLDRTLWSAIRRQLDGFLARMRAADAVD